jgi:hypothetical protein
MNFMETQLQFNILPLLVLEIKPRILLSKKTIIVKIISSMLLETDTMPQIVRHARLALLGSN